jgi:ABC-type transporter Mla subunit MlaD
MTSNDLTIEILREIRDGIRDLRTDFMQRLDETNSRLDQTNARLENVEHGLLDLGKFMRQIALDQARHERFHTHHVDILEDDMKDLKVRVQRLEDRAGA